MAVVKLAEGYDGIRGRRGIIRYRLFKDTQTIFTPRRPTRPRNPLSEKKRAARKLYQWLDKGSARAKAMFGEPRYYRKKLGRASWWSQGDFAGTFPPMYFRGFLAQYLQAPPVGDGPDLDWRPYRQTWRRTPDWYITVTVQGRQIRFDPNAYHVPKSTSPFGYVVYAIDAGWRKDPPEWDDQVKGSVGANWRRGRHYYPLTLTLSTPGDYLLYAALVTYLTGYRSNPNHAEWWDVWRGRVQVS